MFNTQWLHLQGEASLLSKHCCYRLGWKFSRGGGVPYFSSRRGCDFSIKRGAREGPSYLGVLLCK